MSTTGNGDWHSTACVLCSINCGLQVRVEDNKIVKVKGDRANPFSRGYTCSKGLTVAKYQTHKMRLTTPLKKQPDGTHAPISWDQAISEIAERTNAVIQKHGPRAVGLVGGGGQANHLDFVYAAGFLQLMGSPWHFHTLAQEFTQKYWVTGQMFGSEGIDYEANIHDADVLIIIGGNPYLSHGFQRARVVLKDRVKDPKRSLIVVDPRRHETAKMADTYLQIRPGTDLYFLLAMLNVVVHEGFVDEAFVAEHSSGWDEVKFIADLVTPAKAAQLCDLSEADIVATARRFGKAESASIHAHLGIYHGKNMVVNSYLVALLQIITGNMCTEAGTHFPVTLTSGGGVFKDIAEEDKERTRVAKLAEIRGLFSPNTIPEEILDAGEARVRAFFVEAANPILSYADARRMREAFDDLDLLVVIDVTMTEAGMMADYVLPSPSGYEKWETSLFPKGHPDVYMHLRRPMLDAPAEAKQEGIIFYELAKAMGLNYQAHPAFMALEQAIEAGEDTPVLSLVRGMLMGFTMNFYSELVEAGTISGDGDAPAELFQHLLDHPEGAHLCRVDPGANWEQIAYPDKKARLEVPYVLDALRDLELPDDTDFRNDPEFPFILQTGERTDYNCNTIQRDPSWRKKDQTSYLRMHETVAEELKIIDGETVKLVTEYAEAMVAARVTDDIYPGNLSMPHGYGMLWQNDDTGEWETIGVNVQELISAEHRDPLTGVPYHKHIPCRVEKVAVN